MFTGIIRTSGEILSVKNVQKGKRLTIRADVKFIKRLENGITSVAIDGSCHTVEESAEKHFTVFSSFETLRMTTLERLKAGSRVNLELPLTPQTLLDGHIVQGHVDGTGKIASIKKEGEAFLYRFTADHGILQYLVEKDSVAVDGISLTLFHIDDSSFQVAVIPETAKNTTLSLKKEGGKVNIEVNILSKYARKFLKDKDNKYSAFFGKDWK